MNTHPVCWGIDIGHASLKAVKLQRSGSEVTVLGYAIEPIIVAEDANRDEAVVNALRNLAMREEIHDTPVVSALSGRQVLTRTVNIPAIGKKNLDRMIELEARQQIPGDFDEIEWGYHLSPGADGASNDVALFAVKRELPQDLIGKAQRAGLNLVGVSISSLALYNFIRYDQSFPEDETVIVLDVGAENTDLVCYQGDGLWMRTLTLSGNDITKAFMKKFRVSFEEAEALKRQAQDSKQSDRIVKVIEGTLNELCGEVQRSLGFYKSQMPSAKLDNLVISGTTFRLPGLPEYLAERLRYTVNILEDLARVKVAPGLDRSHFMHDLASLGVAMGLALQGVGAAHAAVDLMPSAAQLERVLHAKRWAAVVAAAALAVAIGVEFSVVGGVLEDNQKLVKDVKDAGKGFEERMKVSSELLGQVPVRAKALKAFDAYGAQQGASHGVLSGVLGALQEIATANPPAAQPGDAPPLQNLYVQAIELPDAAFATEAGPFRPFAVGRAVTVVVSIPNAANPKAVSERVQAALKSLPVPEQAVPARGDVLAFRERWSKEHPGESDSPQRREREPRLFSDVQVLSFPEDRLSYWYIDTAHLDEKGAVTDQSQERTLPVRTYTISCPLGGVQK